MKLEEVVANSLDVRLAELGMDRDLAKDIQTRLIALGCLDPPADGAFGPISTVALMKYAKAVGFELDEIISVDLSKSLLDNSEETFIPLTLGDDFASRIVKYMKLKNYWLAKLPGFLNIVYVEGADMYGEPNADEYNKFNDRRMVIAIENGKPVEKFNVLATTEPGEYYTEHPMNSAGAARIAFGQYKAWCVGFHHPGAQPPSRHEALVQVGELKVHRDYNRDGKRTGDVIDAGSGFFINQHSGRDQHEDNIGRASAGCLVGRRHNGHEEFMTLVKTDPRYRTGTHGYRYITTVIAGDDLKNQVG